MRLFLYFVVFRREINPFLVINYIKPCSFARIMGKKTATRSLGISRHEKLAKKAKRRVVFLAIFISAIMILSAFGVMLFGFSSDSSESYVVGNYTFQPIVGEQSYSWRISKAPNKAHVGLIFETLPPEAYGDYFSPSKIRVLATLRSPSYVYISIAHPSSDVELQLLQFHELARYYLIDTLQRNGLTSIPSTFSNKTIIEQPLISCDDATPQIPVINIKDPSISETELSEGIHLENPNCITIVAFSPYAALQYVDALRFAYLQ
jgi:hypothetical protein